MPKNASSISTGIYRTETISPGRKIRLDAAAFKDKSMAEKTVEQLHRIFQTGDFEYLQGPIHKEIFSLQKWANGAIEHYGGDPKAEAITRRTRELVHDISDLQERLSKLEEDHPAIALKLQALAYSAYRVGRRAEIVSVSRFEGAVKTGAKIRRAYANNREERTRTLAPRNEKLRNEARRMKEQRPDLSLNSIAKNLQTRLHPGVGTRQIRNIIRRL